jgi:lipopolysaccharide export system protein LptA
MNFRSNAILFCLFVICVSAHAQPAISGKVSGGFQAPASRDNEGRRHVLKGSDAKPIGNKIFEITAPRVTSFRPDNTLDMVIEAPICQFDSNSNIASSDSDLSFKTTDGRFSIQGAGWLWDPSQSHLTISNKVVALVQKSALANSSVGADARLKTQTNQPVRITSKFFIYDGNLATFDGGVRVEDGADTLICDKLMIDFQNPEGVQKIEAVGDVGLLQNETEVHSGRAIYNTKDNMIQILEKPVWKSGLREGSSDTLLLDRTKNAFFADGNVYMKLPFTNVVSTNIVATTTNAPSTNRFLEIFSEKFRFTNASTSGPSHAFYEKNVRARYEETQLRCAELNVDFSTNNQVRRILASKDVEIVSGENHAFGDSAVYDVSTDKINLVGNPHWELGNTHGRSQTLVLFPKTKEIYAFQNVEMSMPSHAMANLQLFGIRTNSPTTTNKQTTVQISANNFSHQNNVSVFHDNVQVIDERGKLECGMITVSTGASNQVQRIVAEKEVVISQKDLVAKGAQATYDVPQGLIYLTGNPSISSTGRVAVAEAFIINRNKNTFSVLPGKYRIKMEAKQKENTSPFNIKS